MIRFGLYSGILALALMTCQAEVVDRMVAVVNKQVILQSELEEAARMELLQSGKPLRELTDAELRAVLDRLIDQSLLRQQMAGADMPGSSLLDLSGEELSAKIAELHAKLLPGASDPAAWPALLARYDLAEQDVEAGMMAEFRVLRFVDLRFRGLAHAERAAVAQYYQDELVPALRRQGVPEPGLTPEVSSKIEQVLTERSMNSLLNAWLETLRSQAHIQKLAPEPRLAAGAPAIEARP